MTLKTKAFGDIITFTRSSGGGRFNAQGVYEWLPANEPRIDYDPVTGECRGLLIEESRTNLLTYSSDFANSVWTKSNSSVMANAVTAPDGTLTADKLVENSNNSAHAVFSGIGTVTGTYTVSAYLKAAERTKASISLGSGIDRADIDLTAGTIQMVGTVGVSATIQPLLDGWFRVTFTRTFANPNNTFGLIGTRNDAGAYIYTGDGTSGIYIWGAQLEAGAFPTSYIPTPAIFTGRASSGTYFDADGVLKIAAAGEARYTHAYIDGKWVSAGLLLEEGRTNLLTHSSDFANAAWQKTAAAVTTDIAVSPDGTSSADKLVADATNSSHYVRQVFSFTAATRYTLTVFAKAAEKPALGLILPAVAFNGVDQAVGFDLIAKTTTVRSGAPSATIVDVGGGWARCSITATASASASNAAYVFVYNSAFGGSVYTGDGTSGIYIWGAQLEVGASPSSYIPTTTAQVTRAADTWTSSQVTRAADQCVVSNLADWYRADEGAIVISADIYPRSSGFPPLFELSSDFHIIRNMASGVAGGSGRGSPGFSVVYGTPLRLRAASRYTDSNVQNAFNGVMGALNNLTRTNATTSLNIGWKAAGGAGYLNGHIKSIRYFPRALSNTELQEITA